MVQIIIVHWCLLILYQYLGGFQPTKLNADQKWSQTVSKHLASTQANSDLDNKPKQMLKEADDILNQNQSATVRSSYRMPPGTTRSRHENRIFGFLSSRQS